MHTNGIEAVWTLDGGTTTITKCYEVCVADATWFKYTVAIPDKVTSLDVCFGGYYGIGAFIFNLAGGGSV